MPTLKTATGLILCLLGHPVAEAQIAVDPTVKVQTAETGAGGIESQAIGPVTDDTGEFALEAADAALEQTLEEAPAITGNLFSLHGGLRVTADDNLFLSNTDEISDTVFSITGGFKLTKGSANKNLIRLTYDAIGRIYLDHDDLNDLDHAAALSGSWNLAKTRIQLEADYKELSNADREARAFTDRQVANAELTFEHDISGKTIAEGGLLYRTIQYSDFNSSTDYSGRLGVGYKITGKTTLGLAGVMGYLDSENKPEQVYEQLLLTAGYNASGKLTFKGDAGIQFRQFDVEEGEDENSGFVFKLKSAYQPRERTGFALTASRSTVGSATSVGRSIDRTSISLGLNQKIGQRFGLGLTGGYDFSDYTATSGSNTESEEEGWFGRSTFTFSPSDRTKVEVFYEITDIESTPETRSYQNNQFGLSLGISF